MALSNLALFGGAFFTPVLVGKITQTIGWQWSFYLIAIFAGALLPLQFFFVPETAFTRPEHQTPQRLGEDTLGFVNGQHEVHASGEDKDIQTPDQSGPASFEKHDSHSQPRKASPPYARIPDVNTIPPKATFIQSLRPFNGRKSDANFFKLLLRPFPLFFHPAVLWACLIQGTLIGWTVMIGVVLAAIFLGPPLWFNEVETGYMYTGPFVGAILGFIISGLLADWSTKLMIKRNKGVYEPEFRIVLVALQMVFGCVGLYGFGITAENVGRYGWFLPDLFFAFEVGGMVLGAVASALYIVDAHRSSPVPFPLPSAHLHLFFYGVQSSFADNNMIDPGDIAVEAFTCLLIFKNVFSFALTWGAYDWLTTAGISKTFYIVASIQVGICLLSIPMCKLSDSMSSDIFIS